MLTDRMHQVLMFIDRYINLHGKAPSYEEISGGTTVGNKSRVFILINALEERGFIKRLKNRARAIEVLRVPETKKSFQGRVAEWMLACFGEAIAADRMERNHRFLEESLELVQANGCTQSEAHQLVDYVFNRPIGELEQEVGGVMVTLAALCGASGTDMHKCGDTELDRVWKKMDQIRAKQAAKPKHSPLPGDVSC